MNADPLFNPSEYPGGHTAPHTPSLVDSADLFRNLPMGLHFCHFYRTQEELVGHAIQFILAGLDEGHGCIWVVSDFVGRTLAMARLRVAVPGIENRIASAQLKVLSAEEFYLREGAMRPAHELMEYWGREHDDTLRRGYSALRVVGDTHWLRPAHWEALRAYEKQGDSGLRGTRMIGLCCYPLSRWSAAEAIEISGFHMSSILTADGRLSTVGSRAIAELPAATASVAAPQERKFRTLVERACDPLALIAADGRLDYASTSASEWLGHGIGRYMGDLPLDFVHVDDRLRITELLQQAFGEAGSQASVECRLRCSDRTWRWHEIRAKNALGDPEIEAVVLIFRDVKDRREAQDAARLREQRYQKLAEHLDANLWVVDSQAQPVYVNQHWLDYTGLTFEQHRRGMWADRVHPDDLPGLLSAWQEAWTSNGIFAYEYRVRNRFGQYRWHLGRTVAVRNAQGKVVEWVGISVDIEDEKRRAADEKLRALSEEKEAGLDEAHRRLKQNLRLVSSLLSLQQEHLIDAEDYLGNLVGLLATSEAVLPNVQVEIDAQKIALPADCATICGLIVHELLSNALEHAFPGGRKGRVEIKLRKSADGELKLTVRDDGVGLPKGLDFENPKTLGLRMARALTQQLGACAQLAGSGGTLFTCTFKIPNK